MSGFSWRNAISLVSKGGLYRGFSACLIGIAPEKALKLTVNDLCRDYFTASNGSSGSHGSIQLYQEMIAGSMAGMIQLIVTVPYESVKIRLQMKTAPSTSAAMRKMGVAGLYRGLTATAGRDIPFCLFFFPLYSQIKAQTMSRYYPEQQGQASEPFSVTLTAGILAGAVSAVVVTPADMLKTRIQQGLHGDLSFREYARQVVAREGMLALFKGWQARVLVIAPLYGIVSLAFEIQKKLLGL